MQDTVRSAGMFAALALLLAVPVLAATVDEYAISETPVYGTVTGTYADTQVSDNVYESIREVLRGGSYNYSWCEHKWVFNVTAGTSHQFRIEAYRPSNSDNDNFQFAYSTNDSTYTNMVSVTKSSDDNTDQTYGLPAGTSGTVYVRVRDTNRQKNRASLDYVYIDRMLIRTTYNAAPTVDAGNNQTITLPSVANLDGTVSDDGLPNPPAAVTVTWSKVSGPGTVTFGNANAVDTTATFDAAGTYVLQLLASDSALQSTDTVTITVNAGSTITYVDGILTYGSPSDLGTVIDPSGLNEVAVSYGISKASFQALNPQVVAFNGAPAPTQTLQALVAYYNPTSTVTFTFPAAMYNYGSYTSVGRGAFSGAALQDAISTVPTQPDSLYDWFDATISCTGGNGVKALGFCVAFRNDQAVSAGQVLFTLSDATTESISLPALGGGGNPEYVFIGYQAPVDKTITRIQASRTSAAGGGWVSIDDLSFVMVPLADTTPPAAVSNLAAGSPTASSLVLTWTAPGDDGNTGTAASYDIRYSTSTINDGNWASATQVSGEPTPAAAGTNQNMTVGGLSGDTTYYFAIKTSDEVPNTSALSNVPSGTTSDTVAPAAVSNLATSSPTGSSITLTWTAPGDNGSTGTAASYDIRYRTGGAVDDGNWASATEVTGEPAPAAAGTNQNMVVGGLSPNTTYYFAIKTADEVPNTSGISNSPSGTTLDTVAPAAVSNLATSGPTSTSITLTWTAPGDDGSTGTAASYDIRYRTGGAVDDSNWSSATQVTGEPAPAAAGTNQNMVVGGLSASTTYYFAIKTSDEVPNTSAISNSPSGTTSAPPAPNIVAFKRDAGLTAGGAIDSRFNSATVMTVTVADAAIYSVANSRWMNGGQIPSTNSASQLLYRFDVSSIPTSSTINLAQLRLYHSSGNSGGCGVAPILTHAWTEGPGTVDMGSYPGAAGGVSWAHPNGYNTGANQNASGGTTPPLQTWGAGNDSFFSTSADCGTLQTPSSEPSGAGFHVINVTNHVQAWINGTPNYGWAQPLGNWVFYFSESGSANQPVLFIDYTSGGGGDTTAPAAVSNLATSSPTSTSLTLTWTAPGDDGSTGTATSYDIRYRTGGAVDDSNWASATQVSGEPAPQVAGTNQNMVVGGLSAGTTYYFAMKTSDEVPNTSAISNSPSGTTSAGDTTAPAAMNNLATSNPTSSSITLTWTAPGDDGNSGTATSYDIRYRAGGAVNDGNWASATQVTGEPTPQVAGTNQNMVVGGLAGSTTYYFAIKTSDEVPNTSAISNSPSGTTQAGQGNPKPILGQSDFVYQGYYIVQRGGYAAPELAELNYGQGFTHRYVSGQLRFLTFSFFGNVPGGGFHLVEFAKPANLGDTVSTRTNHWPDIMGSTGLGYGNGVWMGLWFEEAQNRLWTTWAIDYPDGPSEPYTKSLVVRTLNADGTVSNVQGPWGLQGIQQRRVYGGVAPVPAWFQSTYGCGPYSVGWGGYASRMGIGPVSLGPTCYTFPEPTGYPVGDIPTSAFKSLMDHSSATLGPDWYAQGYPTTGDRGVRNTDVDNDYDTPYWQSPAPDGLGRWTWGDSNWNTGCWIETPNKQGFILIPKLCNGRTWYETSTLHCERQSEEIQVFDPNMLGEVAQGTRASWNTYPTNRWEITSTLTPLGFNWARSGNGPDGGACGASYDSTTQTLYVYCVGGNNWNSYILVYHVN